MEFKLIILLASGCCGIWGVFLVEFGSTAVADREKLDSRLDVELRGLVLEAMVVGRFKGEIV